LYTCPINLILSGFSMSFPCKIFRLWIDCFPRRVNF
jgi:hypothetical protein